MCSLKSGSLSIFAVVDNMDHHVRYDWFGTSFFFCKNKYGSQAHLS